MKQEIPEAWLINLPWTTLIEPNLGLSILSSKLKSDGISCRVWNPCLELLQFLKPNTYFAISKVPALNDFLFSYVIDSHMTKAQLRLLREKTLQLLNWGVIDYFEYNGIDGVMDQIIQLRQIKIPDWLLNCAQKIASSNATLVGFSCMYDQTISSLALAKIVKELAPNKMFALGGYAVRPPTAQAILKSFKWIDVICVGEGEAVITHLANASAKIISIDDVPGILYRTKTCDIVKSRTPKKIDLNNSPIPDFSDFYKDLDLLFKNHRVEVTVDRIPIETSRGCWWGEKNQCVFCGIHSENIKYRYRKAEKVIEILDQLYLEWKNESFYFSDYILPYQYYKTLLPKLAEDKKPYKISTEIKANISAKQMSLLSKAGFIEIQPGIESFSTSILKKMNKGVSAIQNVYILLLAERNNIVVNYNLLFGLPDETENEVNEMLNQLPKLFHLMPPSNCTEIQITRFSPLQSFPLKFNISPSQYENYYDLIFSKEYCKENNINLNDYAYYFERPYEYAPRLTKLYKKLQLLAIKWKKEKLSRDVHLIYETMQDTILISDTRKHREPIFYQLDEKESLVFIHCIEPVSSINLRKNLGGKIGINKIRDILKKFHEMQIIFNDKDKFLVLALPRIT